MKRFIYLLIFTLAFGMNGWALTAGDIAIIAVNTDATKNMAFVALADIPSGTTISFTDNAWNATTQAWRTGEGTITWSHTSTVTAGTVVVLTVNANPFTASVGTVSYNSLFNLAAAGDQVLAYEGTTAPTTNVAASWLYGFSIENWVFGNNTNSSDIPTALASYSVGMTSSTTEVDNAYFANGATSQTTVSVSGSKADLLLLFNNSAKYYQNDTGPLTLPTYTITVTTGTTSPTVTTQAVTDISTTTATGNGTITATGGIDADIRGFCWDLATNPDPDISDSHSTENGTFGTGTFTGSITGLTAGTQYKVTAYATNSAKGVGYGNVVTFTTLSNEPSNHPSSFTATTNSASSITTAWSDNDGAQAASGFLVLANTSGTFTDPVDGTAQTDDNDLTDNSGKMNVAHGTGTYEWNTGLTQGTQYFFKIFAYNGSDATINYKTDPTVPTANATTSSTSVINVNPATLTGFSYVQGSGPSTGKTFELSGSNLTPAAGDLTVTGSTNYEVSVNGTDYYASRTVSYTGGTLAATTIYVRLMAGLTAGNYNSENVACSGGGADSKNVTCSGTVYKDVPGNHVANFLAGTGTPSYSVIDVIWDDAVGGTLPDAYLIKGSSVSYAAIVAPVNGTPESDGALVKNVNYAVETASFTGLSESTTYYFKIFPYTNSGAQILYKTDGTVPETSETTEVRPIPTYTWNVASGNWNTAASWTPERTTPANDDVLIFDGTVQASPVVTLDFTSPQTIGRLRIINNAAVTFGTSSVSRTLNVGSTGAVSPQLQIAAGSSLTSSAINGITINVPTGFTGSISGNITYTGAAHKLTAADASAVTFNSGAVFTAGTGFSSNAFGTASYNSIVFANGSSYIQLAGSNPFGASQPNSAVVFQTGSLFKMMANLIPSVSGRTYANLEIDAAAFSQNITGAAAFTVDNLTITNATLVGLNNTGGINIKGNITVSAGTLSFLPASAASINLNGTSLQTISGAGTFTAGANSTFNINNPAGVKLSKAATFNNLTIMPSSFFDIFMEGFCSVTGAIDNQAGAAGLKIKSDATGTGALLHNTANVPATIERYLPGQTGNDNGWHMISSPIEDQLIAGAFTDPTPASYDFFAWDEPTSTWLNQKNVAHGITNFIPGKGYLVSYLNNSTRNFTGEMNVGNYSPAITYTTGKGYNFIGNAYPCALTGNITSWTKTNVEDWIYVYEETSGNYLTWNGATGTLTGGIIPAMQAFVVKANGVSPAITVPAASRTTGHTNVYKEGLMDALLLHATAPTGQKDGVVVWFSEEASAGIDKSDVPRLSGLSATAPLLYTKIGDVGYSINTLPYDEQARIVPLYFTAGMDGNYTISASQLETFDAGSVINLEDTRSGQVQNLMIDPEYQFTAAKGDDPARFKLHFAGTFGIGEPAAIQPIRIYSDGSSIFLEATGQPVEQAQVTVCNLLGQEIATRMVNLPGIVNLQGIRHQGVCIVKVQAGNTVVSGKVFIR